MAELANQEYAANVVAYLLAMYPQQAHDPDLYAEKLIVLCTGRPKSLLSTMVNPVEGLVGKEKFLPSLATVKDWLDKYAPPRTQRQIEQQYQAQQDRLNRKWDMERQCWVPFVEDTENREDRARMLQGVAQTIRETVKAKCVGRPSVPPGLQARVGARLLETDLMQGHYSNGQSQTWQEE